MHDPTGDLQRLEQGAEGRSGSSTSLDCDVRAIQGLQQALRKGDWKVTVAVHMGKQITRRLAGLPRQDLWHWPSMSARPPSPRHLCDLATGEVVASSGLMNPQIRFGEDLMSRVSYVMMNPGGDVDMTKAVRDALNDLVQAVVEGSRLHGRRRAGMHLRRQPDHASPAAGHQS